MDSIFEGWRWLGWLITLGWIGLVFFTNLGGVAVG